MIEDRDSKKSKLEKDKTFVRIACHRHGKDKNGKPLMQHQLEVVKPHANTLVDNDISCHMCLQPSLNSQKDGYYKCTHRDCDPEVAHKDCKGSPPGIHINCTNKNYYMLCRMCALNQKKLITKEFKPWFHEHVMRRHPINHSN